MDRKSWHPAFCGVTKWELKLNKADLFFDPEHLLSEEPLRIDMLVIKKQPAAVVKNEIGKIFKQHNIVEFKGSGDGLTIDDYYKAVGYASIYKSLGEHVNEIPAQEITVTLIREAYPREMFKLLKTLGMDATEKYKGIYYLSGKTTFDTQVIVTSRLDGEKHAGLKILSRRAKKDDIIRFLEEARLATEPGELHDIDAVLQVSVSANREVYQEVRKEKSMCQALKDLMKEEIAEERAKERAEATADTKIVDIKELMKNMKWTADQAMKALGISVADQAKYSAML